MALKLSRLIRNLANIKHEHTNQNKFLKTKAKVKEMKELYVQNRASGIVCLLTFLSTIIFPLLSLELYEGVTTHIWTGIIFGFILHLLIPQEASEESIS